MLKDRERFDLVAHFPSMEKARTAKGTLGGRVKQETTATFGRASWAGLGAGIVLGMIIGLLLYRAHPGEGFLPAAVAQRGLLAAPLWAAILGASGWILGTSIHLFSTTPGPDHFELHVTIQAAELSEMRKLLLAEGATSVSVKGVGSPNVEQRPNADPLRNHATS